MNLWMPTFKWNPRELLAQAIDVMALTMSSSNPHERFNHLLTWKMQPHRKQNPIARNSILNISIFYDYSIQIIVLEKTSNLFSLWVLSKRKTIFSFFPQYHSIPHKALFFFLSIGFKFVFHSLVSLRACLVG